jgi:ATP-binding cassette, subfamily B, bacterial
MSWMPVGGGGFGGGAVGGALGGRGGNSAASPEGLPFAGIPPELRVAVEKLVAKEPDHGEPDAVFTHQVTDRRRLTLWLLLRRHRAAVILAGVLVIIETLTLQAGPYLTQIGIDRGILVKNFGVVAWAAIAYFAAVVCGMAAERGRIGWTGRLAAWVMNDLRVKVFTHLQRMSLDYYTDEPAGVIMTRMTSDIEVLQQLLQDGLVQFAIQGLTIVVVAAVLFSYNVRLAVITVVLIVPVLTGFSMWFRSASQRGYLRVRDGIAGVLADLSENLHGVRIVAAHNRQRHNILHHRNVVGVYRDANNYTAHVNAVYGPGTQLLGILGQAALLGIGGYMVVHHELTVGELTAFVLYLNSFFQPIQQLVQLYNTYQQGQAAITKLRGLLATDPTVSEEPGAYDLPAIEGAVSFDHVSFGYDPDRPVLRDVDLHIKAGETIAFVGPTGAGKSTMAKLVTRFYDPTEGRVLIDGHDLQAVTIKSLRRQLGVVPQEPFLFAGSIRDNIAYARPDATEEELNEAVRLVGLSDLVDRTPQGLDAVVHERGQSLSSGERQLLALARAFLAHPRVLVLDEATSNLDLQTETRVEAALDVLLEGRTAILIAHRLSTAMRADRIVVVDEGGIVEIGSHAELVTRGERYAEMYATWIMHSHAAA